MVKKHSAASFMVVVLLCYSCNTIQRLDAADPDPLTDFSPNADSFVFRDIFKNAVVTSGSGGHRAALSPQKFPAIESQGLTVVQFRMVPCGLNRPHTHPRATEILSLLSGGPLQAGFVDTEGGAVLEILHPGDVIVFPRGLLHFELNVGNETAFFLSALNSQSPGTLEAAGALFALPDRVAAATMNQNVKGYRKMKKHALPYENPATLLLAEDCVPGRDVNTDS